MSLPQDRAAYETRLDGKDPKWRPKEADRKFVLIVDHCFPTRIADPTDESAIAQATEDFWARFGARLNVETSTMKQDEDPRTDAGKWIQEDILFGNAGSGQDIELSADDYATWPLHLTQWHYKLLSITGRDA